MGLLTGCGLRVDGGHVPGVHRVQGDGNAEEVLTERRQRLVHLDHRVEQRGHRASIDLGPILLGTRSIPGEDRGDVGGNRIAPG